MAGHYYTYGRKFTTRNERFQNALESMFIDMYGSDLGFEMYMDFADSEIYRFMKQNPDCGFSFF